MPGIETRAAAPHAVPYSDARFALYAWFALAYNFGVVLWGAFVRATGSGAGCGNHWPLCNGALTPPAPSVATLIEFTHRVTSGLDLALVALLVAWAFRAFPRRHPARLGAALSAVFLATEALLGASLVLLEHVAKNASANRAWSLSAHLVNTLTLLACLTLTAWWAGGRPAARPRGREAWLAASTLAAFMLLGVSGAIAALGDTLFPAHSLSAGFAQDLSPTANIFLRLRLWHPVLAALCGLWLAFYGVSAVLRRRDAQLSAGVMMTLVGVQLAAGLMNLFLLAPVWMQIAHLLLADLLWVSIVLLCARMAAAPGKVYRAADERR
ncbi:MAG: COX15/CtaA family protein [Bryobacteraceae bacterium]|jgi:heme A synthase